MSKPAGGPEVDVKINENVTVKFNMDSVMNNV